jgi:hypothetical protein
MSKNLKVFVRKPFSSEAGGHFMLSLFLRSLSNLTDSYKDEEAYALSEALNCWSILKII